MNLLRFEKAAQIHSPTTKHVNKYINPDQQKQYWISYAQRRALIPTVSNFSHVLSSPSHPTYLSSFSSSLYNRAPFLRYINTSGQLTSAYQGTLVTASNI